MKIRIRLIDGGRMPEKAHEGDACHDCHARIDRDTANGEIPGLGMVVTIKPRERARIPLGFALGLPDGWEAQVRPRSGLTSRGIDGGFGTVDSNYRGEVCAVVINNSASDFIVKDGDRICQLAVRRIPGRFKGSPNSFCDGNPYANAVRAFQVADGTESGTLSYAVQLLAGAIETLCDDSIEFERVDELDCTERGESGFGSSGM